MYIASIINLCMHSSFVVVLFYFHRLTHSARTILLSSPPRALKSATWPSIQVSRAPPLRLFYAKKRAKRSLSSIRLPRARAAKAPCVVQGPGHRRRALRNSLMRSVMNPNLLHLRYTHQSKIMSVKARRGIDTQVTFQFSSFHH